MIWDASANFRLRYEYSLPRPALSLCALAKSSRFAATTTSGHLHIFSLAESSDEGFPTRTASLANTLTSIDSSKSPFMRELWQVQAHSEMATNACSLTETQVCQRKVFL